MRADALAREIEGLAQAGRSERLAGLAQALRGCFAAGRRALQAYLTATG
jgi:hypothetical protein